MLQEHIYNCLLVRKYGPASFHIIAAIEVKAHSKWLHYEEHFAFEYANKYLFLIGSKEVCTGILEAYPRMNGIDVKSEDENDREELKHGNVCDNEGVQDKSANRRPLSNSAFATATEG